MTGKTPPSRRLFWLGLLLLLGAGIRLLYLVYPYMDADQAINGLMARHILLGEFPIFFYGQEYCGSIEAYLVSTVFFFFGSSRFTLGLTVTLLSLFLIFFIYRLTVLLFDLKTALVAVLLTAVPSYYFVFHSVLARSAYMESPVLGILLFISAGRILYAQDRRPAQYLWLGLLSGLGLWTHFLFVFYLAPVGLLLLLNEKAFWRDPKVLGYLSAGLALGGLPLWVYNAIHPLATWVQLQQNPVHEPFVDSLIGFFSVRLPELVGLSHGPTNQNLIPYFSPIAYGILLAGFIYLLAIRIRSIFQGVGEDRGSGQGLDLLLIFIFSYPLIFSLSGFSANHTTRYLVPLYPALPILWAALFFHFQKRIPSLSWFLLLMVLWGNGYGLYQWCLVFDPVKASKYQQKQMGDQALIAFLHKRGLRAVYVTDYWRAVPLTFDAEEKIIFAQPYHDRFPYFTHLVDRSPRPAFLNTGNVEGVFEKTVQAIGGSYKKEGHWLYYDFEPPPFDFIELSTKGWQVQPHGVPAAASSAFDRDLSTRWNLGSPMKPGEAFQLDLGETVLDLSRVVLFAGSPEGIPRGLRLELSQDGKSFKTLVDIPDCWISLAWSGPRPFFQMAKGITELVFAPQAGRYLKITQTGTDSQNSWEIAEILVYRGIPRIQKGPPEGVPSLSALRRRLGTLKAERVMADPWIQAQIAPDRTEKNEWPAVRLPESVGDRLPPYPFPAFIAGPGQSEALKKDLNEAAPGVYSEERINGWVLFSGRSDGKGYRKLPRTGWLGSSNDNGREAIRAIDGKIKTRWTSGRPQVPGMSFRVDLGQPEKIARIRLRLGDSYRDFPRRAEIRFSLDGLRWEKAVPLNNPVYWTGEKLFKDYRSGETDLVFREAPARFVEILQTGQDSVYYWSIHELELFTLE
jgi:4-amino-4-deoxy-L-arabinose transferase-like glycosyltransferase